MRNFLWLSVLLTAGVAHAQPISPSVATLPVSAAGATNATLNGTVNPNGAPAFAWFQWGATTNYGNSTPAQALGGGSANLNFSQLLAGLSVDAKYHFRVVASNSASLVFGANQSFITPIFTDIGANLPGRSNPGNSVWEGNIAWGDYDNDGRLDFAFSATNYTTTLWRNTGAGFTNNLKIPGYLGPVSWGDCNNDNRLDLLTSSAIQQNTGGSFTTIQNGGDMGGWAAWGDYNNDGRGDLLLTGYTNDVSSAPLSRLLRNTGSGFIDAPAGLPNAGGRAAWEDYDNDGRLDVALIGYSNATFTAGLAQIWRNTGTGFTNMNAGLPGVYRGCVAWGDYDNDGRPDLLLTGFAPGLGSIAQVWRNTGSGFTNLNAGLPGIDYSWAEWGDYDNDGRLDILLAGKTNLLSQAGGTICQLWRNTGTGFTNVPNFSLPGTCGGTVTWGDYDSDGRLDILVSGYTNFTANGFPTGPVTQIWRNNFPVTNTPPTAPTGLAVSVTGQTATFSWNAVTDAQAPTSGLTYNLRVGTTPGGSEIVSPMSLTNGARLLPQGGNAHRSLSRSIVGVPFGQPIYWSVQAVDIVFAGSPFAPEKTFTFNSVFTPSNGIPVFGDLNGDGIVSESELNTVLSNYFPNSPFLQMTNVAGLGGTNVTFALSNSTAGAFSVEYSTNLSNWFLLGPALPRYLFTDTNAPAPPQRYYRLRWP